MATRPEDVTCWVINDVLVQEKLESFRGLSNGRMLSDTYNKLRGRLTTYPPDQDSFSPPMYSDLGGGCFWVHSDNKQITVRARYHHRQEICIVDKVWLAHETPKDLKPE